MESLIKIDDLGVPLFLETPIYIYTYTSPMDPSWAYPQMSTQAASLLRMYCSTWIRHGEINPSGINDHIA